MKLSTSTGILYERPQGETCSIIHTLQKCSAAGFQHFDFNFYDWHRENTPLLSENWREWVESIVEEAVRLGVDFPQAHICFYPFLNATIPQEERKWLDKIVDRSIFCASQMNVKTIVTHPDTHSMGKDHSFHNNFEYLSKILEKANRLGMRLAIENMWDSQGGASKFCSQPEELIELVNRFKTDWVGICWDFEHASIMNQDSAEIIKLISNKLIATHVSDTHSNTDYAFMHILPFLGPIEWTPIMQALRAIGYEGLFSLEVSHLLNYIPDKLIHSALCFAFDVGTYLIEKCGLD